MNRFKLPIKHRHPHGIRNALWLILSIAAACALWFSITSVRAHYVLIRTVECRIYEAEQRAAMAERDKELAFAILRGKQPAVTEDGLEIARVKWEKVSLVEGL